MVGEPVLKAVVMHEPQEGVICTLRDMLARAERGEVRAVAIAAHTVPTNTSTVYALGDGNIAHLVCALERLKLRLLEEE